MNTDSHRPGSPHCHLRLPAPIHNLKAFASVPMWLIIFMMSATLAAAEQEQAEATPADEHRVGSYKTTFQERAPESARLKVQVRLFNSRLDKKKHPDYTLEDETFSVLVPDNYTPDTPHGLIVWVSPGNDAQPPKEWREELAKRKLIWVGADNAGNDRAIWQRLSLPLDAVHNMGYRYTLDEDRIYIAGLSGGGRCAAHLGVGFADLFDGALAIAGCDFYEEVEAPDKPGHTYRAYKKPSGKLLKHAKKNLRLSVVVGAEDPERDKIKLFYQLYRFHGFKHTAYHEIPDLGHAYPAAEWFGKGLDALDAPLLEARKNPDKQQAQDTPKDGENEKATKSAAQEKLDLARNYLDAGAKDAAKRELNAIIEGYPDTKQARTARAILKALDH